MPKSREHYLFYQQLLGLVILSGTFTTIVDEKRILITNVNTRYELF